MITITIKITHNLNRDDINRDNFRSTKIHNFLESITFTPGKF